MKYVLALGFALLLGGAEAAAAPRYCQPVAVMDYNLLVGHRPVIQTAAHCKLPALVRKLSPTGRPSAPVTIYPGRPERVWTLTGRLQYSLDGKTWTKLRVPWIR